MFWYYNYLSGKVDQDSDFARLYKRALKIGELFIYKGYPSNTLRVCSSNVVVYVIGT